MRKVTVPVDMTSEQKNTVRCAEQTPIDLSIGWRSIPLFICAILMAVICTF